ncbi:hypothetical protein [Planotetraspora sp. GP83]|uniref:hypothetical protein n=1 Tax=Planotetraspora sp. GP83 TaxID=3156264 RepID=UPI00351465B6
MRQRSVITTDIVEYECKPNGSTQTQEIKVKIELTMPTGATTREQMTIGWRGTYAEGAELRAPAVGLSAGTKLYAYASISGLAGLTSATGVGTLNTVSGGEIIPLPQDEGGCQLEQPWMGRITTSRDPHPTAPTTRPGCP